jgi:KaiC/GvpD/RAD55 family RecA-like ATPase
MRATKAGTFDLNPQVIYIDDLGETKICKLKPDTVDVKPVLHRIVGKESLTVPILPGRVTTGFEDLDMLLFGGIPDNYAVMLTSPSIDELELLIRRFLEAGIRSGEATYYIATKSSNARTLAEEFQSNFFLFICNTQADTIASHLPNVFTLKGIDNLTEISIVLTKSFRMLDSTHVGPRRVCIEIVSDVLLQHHAVTTRKWLSELLPTFKSKGFTTLAVVNPQMHPQEEVQAILSLFEGEIRISEKENAKGIEKVLRIRKLNNQKYLENEIALTREKLAP